MYLQAGQLDDGLALFDRWMELPTVTPRPDDYYLKATILYQLERWQDALAPLEQAMAAAEEPAESHYQLLYVLQYQSNDYDGMLSTLETLNARWPGEQWANALAGAKLLQEGADLVESATGDAIRQQRPDQANREYLPIVTAAPIYPPSAASRGLEGYVVVSYTVNRQGTTDDIEVVESSAAEFEEAAIEAVRKYKYRPRMIDGTPIEVPGVASRIEFELAEGARE